jgi:hypothetical protein
MIDDPVSDATPHDPAVTDAVLASSGIDLGDLSHLTPADAELFKILYYQRNRVLRGELLRVRNDMRRAGTEPASSTGRGQTWGRKPGPEAAERFLRYVADRTIRIPTGCLLWTGTVTQDGYARIGFAGQRTGHRSIYRAERGPIPRGFTLDHVCHNSDPRCSDGYSCYHRRCLELQHLDVVTRAENTRRGARRRRLSPLTFAVSQG